MAEFQHQKHSDSFWMFRIKTHSIVIKWTWKVYYYCCYYYYYYYYYSNDDNYDGNGDDIMIMTRMMLIISIILLWIWGTTVRVGWYACYTTYFSLKKITAAPKLKTQDSRLKCEKIDVSVWIAAPITNLVMHNWQSHLQYMQCIHLSNSKAWIFKSHIGLPVFALLDPILPQPIRLCFCLCWFVCLSFCLLTTLLKKVIDRFWLHFQKSSTMTQKVWGDLACHLNPGMWGNKLTWPRFVLSQCFSN